jgi:hypothetical protein
MTSFIAAAARAAPPASSRPFPQPRPSPRLLSWESSPCSSVSLVVHGRTRMIVCPLIRSVGLKAATASSRVATLPMFVRSRPSRTRWTISPSWARSGRTTKSIAKPFGLCVTPDSFFQRTRIALKMSIVGMPLGSIGQMSLGLQCQADEVTAAMDPARRSRLTHDEIAVSREFRVSARRGDDCGEASVRLF